MQLPKTLIPLNIYPVMENIGKHEQEIIEFYILYSLFSIEYILLFCDLKAWFDICLIEYMLVVVSCLVIA